MKELQFLVVICAMFSCGSFVLIAIMFNEFRNSFAKVMKRVTPDFASKVKIEKPVSFHEAVYSLQNGLADYAEIYVESYSVMIVVGGVPAIITREDYFRTDKAGYPFRNVTAEKDGMHSYYLKFKREVQKA
jgi:hypothetical protein